MTGPWSSEPDQDEQDRWNADPGGDKGAVIGRVANAAHAPGRATVATARRRAKT